MNIDTVRLLFLPNGHQPGPSACFRRLLDTRQIEAYAEYDFLAKSEHDPDFALRGDEILSMAARVRPNIILWQHVGREPLTRDFLHRLREVAPHARLAFQELDPWGGRTKRITKAMGLLCQECDDLVLCGGWQFERAFRRHLRPGTRVHWFGHTGDERWLQCGEVQGVDVRRDFDVVMVGSNMLPRWRWLRFVPLACHVGAPMRYKAVHAVSLAFGTRAAIFGKGWEGLAGNQGLLPFEQQVVAQRRGWVSAMWNNFDQVPFYFSDRPVIALLGGVPHVTNYQTGYELVFGPNGQNLFWAANVREFVDTLRYLLSRPRSELIEVGRRAREFAIARLKSEVAFRDLISRLAESDWSG